MRTLKFMNGKKIIAEINENEIEAVVVAMKKKELSAQELIDNA